VYVIKTHPQQYLTAMLHELDKEGLKLAKLAYPQHHFEVVSGATAHRWVRDGLPHSTPLYVENGRIRYARDEVAKPRRRNVTSRELANALNSAFGEKLFTGAKR
jgi:hypothetical protein